MAEAHQRDFIAGRMEQLVRLGIRSKIRSAEAQASQQVVSTRCQMADEHLQRLKTELISAQKGMFLRGDANDVPYSQQQRDRLVLRRQDLETALLQDNARSTQLSAEVAEERSRLERLGRANLALPAAHVVWSVTASPDSTVTEGQTIFDLADCGRRFVVVELPEREFEQTKAGDQAVVRFIGSNEWKNGLVRQVRGSAARADDRLLAARVPKPEPDSITVEIALPRDDTPVDRSGFCDIARLAEVRFQRSPDGGVVNFLSRKLQWLAARFDRQTPTL